MCIYTHCTYFVKIKGKIREIKAEGGEPVKARQRDFVAAYLNSTSTKEAAEQAGVSLSTANRYLAQQDVREAIKHEQRKRIEAVSSGMQGMLGKCARTLEEIIDSPSTSAAIKIQAIQTVFTNARALNEQLDLAERLEAIEAKLEESGLK